ncbi:aldose 1-epimerase family protein [Desulfobacula sp.]|uniref:aldose 1-epimerase family protein n=1 Tax=Desulfobacula sp. TaxID=2593537 RepID=UPI001EB67234|nr:aldose 1-epimerase family protein [Desulfobacula sp.]
MAKIFGREIQKEEFLRYLGYYSHVVGISRKKMVEGKTKGAELLEFKTGSGLEFSIALDKCMDILTLSYKGMVLSQLTKNGPTSNKSGLPIKGYFPKAVNGGMMYTCGLLNVGTDYLDDDGVYHPFHGQIGFTPAENAGIKAFWDGDDYVMEATGLMRESAIFGDNLTLYRKIKTQLGSNELEIIDIIENNSPKEAGFNILYHINYGFPFLNEFTELKFPENKVTPLTPESEKCLAECDRVSKPVDGASDQVFLREIMEQEDGSCVIKTENQNLGIGSYLSYQKKSLPNFLHWKSMGSGDYAMGLLPTNSSCDGRPRDIENGTIRTLEPFEKTEFRLKIGVYDL